VVVLLELATVRESKNFATVAVVEGRRGLPMVSSVDFFFSIGDNSDQWVFDNEKCPSTRLLYYLESIFS